MRSTRALVPAPEPDYAVAPGETLRQRLDELDMSQAELARRADLTAKHVNQIVQGAAPISADVAQRLELVTGTPAFWWLRLEADYQATLMRLSLQQAPADQTDWVDTMPVRALVRAGALPAVPRDKGSRLRQLLAFFGVASVDAYFALWARPATAFRQSRAFAVDESAVNAWLRLGEMAAMSRTTAAFDARKLREQVPEMRALTWRRLTESLPELIRIAGECGVAVVFVPDIAGTRAYGATRWVSSSRRPIVQLSLRGRTDDKLWQTVFHEFGHVLLHDRKKVFIEVADDADQSQDTDVAARPQSSDPASVDGEDRRDANSGTGSELDPAEREAEAFARDLLIPPPHLPALRELATVEQVLDFAESLGIAPSLVVARLQAEGWWSYRTGNKLKRRVADAAVQAASSGASGAATAIAGNVTVGTSTHQADPGTGIGITGQVSRRRQWHLPGDGQ